MPSMRRASDSLTVDSRAESGVNVPCTLTLGAAAAPLSVAVERRLSPRPTSPRTATAACAVEGAVGVPIERRSPPIALPTLGLPPLSTPRLWRDEPFSTEASEPAAAGDAAGGRADEGREPGTEPDPTEAIEGGASPRW